MENSFSDYDLQSLSNTSHHVNTNNATAAKTEEELAREKERWKDERVVKRVRLVCLVVFLAASTAVSVAIYKFTRKSEHDAFDLEYQNYVNDIFSLVTWEIKNNFALMAQLAASVTTSARLSQSDWPYLTNVDFEVSGGYLDGLTGIISVVFAPFIEAQNVTEWEEYSVDNQYWVEEGARLRVIHPEHKDPIDGSFQDHEERKFRRHLQTTPPRIPEKIYTLDRDGEQIPYKAAASEILAPAWQIAPTPGSDPKMVNFQLLADPIVSNLVRIIEKTNETVMSKSLEVDYLFDHAFDESEKWQKVFPHSYIAEPVYESFEPDAKKVGFLLGLTSWENLFNNILPEGADGVIVVISGSCGDKLTFRLDGPRPVFLGKDDFHERKFDSKYNHSIVIEDYPNGIVDGLCFHEMSVYPSTVLYNSYETSRPIVYTCAMVLAFLGSATLFLLYDRLVTSRQRKAMADAARSNAIVSSLFPAQVRDRLMADEGDRVGNKKKMTTEQEWNSYLNLERNKEFGIEDGRDEEELLQSKPIADLFPDVTVMFADIAGFTAWSSAREPAQVFTLLETLYSAFDDIAKKRRVFKVETVGDCYVAACGLPEPHRDHAVAMARFAFDCLVKTNELVRKLECKLGPDTGDLAMRIGLHSGPVTAGVLRGDNARFQLFGDTMNTAARVESSGMRNRIQVSQELADLLVASGKAKWLQRREELIHAKGKGMLQTYWLHLGAGGASSRSSSDGTGTCRESDDGIDDNLRSLPIKTQHALPLKTQRLIEWNSTVVKEKLHDVVRMRNEGLPTNLHTEITDEVSHQIKRYVIAVAHKYHDRPFHNFDHASHVTMSVTKLLSRVVSEESGGTTYTRGISSDALMQLGVVMSALIHDMDHSGVPNARLLEENHPLAQEYQGKSIAENNSIAVAWDLLMQPSFDAFRACIAPTGKELIRFRKIMVTTTLATDITDKDLKADRNERWAIAFSEQAAGNSKEADELKARIVIEHLIQASDICHTMQHWHIFKKWNERLFEEMYKAWREGRASRCPADFWAKGEIGFFDYYVIPLAKKLDQCGVFGVSSDEYLNYAEMNRCEWEMKGPGIVTEYLAKYKAKYDEKVGQDPSSKILTPPSDQNSEATATVLGTNTDHSKHDKNNGQDLSAKILTSPSDPNNETTVTVLGTNTDCSKSDENNGQDPSSKISTPPSDQNREATVAVPGTNIDCTRYDQNDRPGLSGKISPPARNKGATVTVLGTNTACTKYDQHNGQDVSTKIATSPPARNRGDTVKNADKFFI